MNLKRANQASAQNFPGFANIAPNITTTVQCHGHNPRMTGVIIVRHPAEAHGTNGRAFTIQPPDTVLYINILEITGENHGQAQLH